MNVVSLHDKPKIAAALYVAPYRNAYALGDLMRQTTEGVRTDYLLDLTTSLTQTLGAFSPGEDTYYLLGLDVIG